MSRRSGFTIVELLIVVMIIALLATMAVGKYHSVRERAMWSTLEADLRAFSIQQELYYAKTGIYTNNPTLADFQPSGFSAVIVTFADKTGWAAIAQHDGLPGHRCALFYGAAPPEAPATDAGLITCDR